MSSKTDAMPAQERTTVSVSRHTRSRLQRHGDMGESYDQVIIRVLDSYESAHRLLQGQLAGKESP